MVKKSPEYQETKHESSIKYTGVRKRKWGKWVSEVRLPNSRERIWLGSYDSPEKAARAFDAAQYCLRGKSANFNFPDNPPNIPGRLSMTPAEIQAAASKFANLSFSDVRNDHWMVTEVLEDHHHQQESLSYSSSSISDETTVQDFQVVNSFQVVEGEVETSFHEQLNLCTALGSGPLIKHISSFLKWTKNAPKSTQSGIIFLMSVVFLFEYFDVDQFMC
ncbi:ethylene-responsive transcription factor TINY isoform X1 [Beta vulgaris subsp. vulgaris]|uniref:ethylene-responsive transcription factor TINY isoform X1 n=1 Tax=Beta vulgaris subsp. vulgaris TaxID=3555 RepID=UPI00203752B5|nr:ethylene-responsive transcription factor TINY isoform X1 [Beta vulgaris subsp. vulgaris]